MTLQELLSYLSEVDPSALAIVDYGRSYVVNKHPFPRTGPFEGTGAYQCRPKDPTREITGVDGSQIVLSRVSDFTSVDLIKQGERWIDPTPIDARDYPVMERSIRIVQAAKRLRHGAVVTEGYLDW
jgi:hypothetical protein